MCAPRRIAAAIMAAVAILGAILQPGSVLADRGARIDAGRIAIDEPLSPGQTYRLPTLGVSDPGDEGATYTMQVNELAGTNAPNASWFEFSPSSFSLDPGRTQAVGITMRIPTSAAPGDYTALIAAEIGSDARQGVGVGAAAAARLTFTIRPASDIDALFNAAAGWFTDNLGWVIPVLVMIALTLATWFLRRHLAIEIRRR